MRRERSETKLWFWWNWNFDEIHFELFLVVQISREFCWIEEIEMKFLIVLRKSRPLLLASSISRSLATLLNIRNSIRILRNLQKLVHNSRNLCGSLTRQTSKLTAELLKRKFNEFWEDEMKIENKFKSNFNNEKCSKNLIAFW